MQKCMHKLLWQKTLRINHNCYGDLLLAAFDNSITRSSYLRDRPWKGMEMEEKREGIKAFRPLVPLVPPPAFFEHAVQAIGLQFWIN